MTTLIKYFFLIIVVALITSSCKKFLDTKSNESLAKPETLDDLQAILDNPNLSIGTSLTNVGTDEYYVTTAEWQNTGELNNRGYIWDPMLDDDIDWLSQYNIVFHANTVLSNLLNITDNKEQAKKDNIKGQALFLRALSFFNVAQLYAPQFDSSSFEKDMGIPLRLKDDFNEKSVRSSVKQTYEQIISDLKIAADLLPDFSPFKFRGSKVACLALLAKVYLQIGSYENAKEYATKCLQINNTLVDYNILDASSPYPLLPYRENPEILYYSSTDAPLNAEVSRAKIDSNLYSSYTSTDLRKTIFFSDNGDGSYAFKGNYTRDYALFTGLAVDEILLIRAECFARLGNFNSGMPDLNTLLIKRHVRGQFTPLVATNSMQALQYILDERKKELVHRSIRWSDLRRLNKEPMFAKTLQRILNNTVYELKPNDLRYTLLIPSFVINNSELQQNIR